MTIAHDSVFTEQIRTGTSDPESFTHTPSGTLRGVWVTINQESSTTDHVVGVTYGGVAMLRVTSDRVQSGELGRSYLFFLGTGIPTGAQTVEIDLSSGTTDDMHIVVGGFTGSADIEPISSNRLGNTAATYTNPSLALTALSRTAVAICAYFSGLNSAASITAGSGMTLCHDHDYASAVRSSVVYRQTTPDTSDYTFSFTAAVEQAAMTAAAFSEIAETHLNWDPNYSTNTRTDTSDPWTFSHTPANALAGVYVAIAQENDSTDNVSGVTYGGQTMTRVRTNADTATEAGRTYLYFLGTGIPTGGQTVSIDLASATGTDMAAVCGGVNAAGDTTIVDDDGTGDNQANPSVTMNVNSNPAIAIGVLYSGASDYEDSQPNTNIVPMVGLIFASATRSARFDRQAVVSDADFTFSYTAATDDVALSVMAISDAVVTLATPSVVSGTTTIGTPTITSDATATPSVVAGTTTIGTPTIEAGVLISPSVVAGTTTIGTPIVTVGGEATATPSTVLGTTTIGAPTIVIDATVTGLTTVAGTTTIGTPTVTSPVLVTPGTVFGTTTMGAPVVLVFLFSSSDIELGGITTEATITDDRDGVFAAIITYPTDGDTVVAGGLTVYATALSGDNTAVEVQVEVSTSPSFLPGGIDEDEDPIVVYTDVSNPVDDGEVAVVSFTGILADTVYYIHARAGHLDTDEWGDWSETISVTATDTTGDGYLWLYASDVDTSEPYPHLWSAHLEGETIVMIGAGFGDPQSEYTGTARATYTLGLVDMTVQSWDRVAATGNATTEDRIIDYQRSADCEHDEVRTAIPSGVDESGVGVYIRIEEPA